MKNLAVQLFGHLRTFRRTFDSFRACVIEPHERGGYAVDVFLHTWDELEFNGGTYHNQNGVIAGTKVSDGDIGFIRKNYKPRELAIERLGAAHGLNLSIAGVNRLRREYEQKTGSEYEWVISTRPDLLFKTPFLVDDYVKEYDGPLSQNIKLTDDALFVANNIFGRMNVSDPRYVAECDLLMFGKGDASLLMLNNKIPESFSDVRQIPIKYHLWKDFELCRAQSERPEARKPVRFRLLRQLAACFIPSKELRRKIRE